jgi:hypothetical protein
MWQQWHQALLLLATFTVATGTLGSPLPVSDLQFNLSGTLEAALKPASLYFNQSFQVGETMSPCVLHDRVFVRVRVCCVQCPGRMHAHTCARSVSRSLARFLTYRTPHTCVTQHHHLQHQHRRREHNH